MLQSLMQIKLKGNLCRVFETKLKEIQIICFKMCLRYGYLLFINN